MINNRNLGMGLQGFNMYKLTDFRQQRNDATLNDFYIIKAFESVDIIVNKEIYRLKVGDLLYVGPDKEIKLADVVSSDGYVIWFTQDYYLRSSVDIKILNSELFYGSQYAVHIDDQRGGQMDFNTNIIERIELAKQDGLETFDLIVHHSIEAILLEGRYRLSLQNILKKLDNSSDLILFNCFRIMVYKYYSQHTSLSFYADKLNLTKSGLSRLCTAQSGKSAKAFISEIVMLLNRNPSIVTED